MDSTAARVVAQAKQAGFEVLHVEQMRANRWLLRLRDHEGAEVLALAQQRPLVGSADVQDLAELMRLRQIAVGYLVAIDGRFSAEAQRSVGELRRLRLTLCDGLPSLKPAAPLATATLETA